MYAIGDYGKLDTLKLLEIVMCTLNNNLRHLQFISQINQTGLEFEKRSQSLTNVIDSLKEKCP